MMWVELAKAIAWPIAAVIMVLSLKTELRSFITKLLSFIPTFLSRKMEIELPGGFKAKVDAAEQQQGENPANLKLEDQKPALEPSPRPAVNVIERRIRQDAASVDPATLEALLFRALAQSRLQAGHEFTYNRIFGSQLIALKRLNERARATVEVLREFFKPYAEQFPEMYASYGFDDWLGFLRVNSLITQTGNTVEITEFARDFLVYLTEARLSEFKPW